jgi:hypothetical protein
MGIHTGLSPFLFIQIQLALIKSQMFVNASDNRNIPTTSSPLVTSKE